MNYNKKLLIAYTFLASVLVSCGGAPLISTPIENIDTSPLKVAELTKAEKENWGHLDLEKDTIPGMGVDRAYAEVINGNKGKKVIVAVIDSGIDIDHEDLDGVIWTNKDEIPNNGKDDDNNGYVDDIHGWNFLGKAYDEQLELTRIVANGDANAPRYAEAKAELDKTVTENQAYKTRIEQINTAFLQADKAVATHLKKEDYTPKEVNEIKTEDETLLNHIAVLNQIYGFGLEDSAAAKKALKGEVERINESLNYNYNVSFKGRKTGDNPDDFDSYPGYGDGNVKPVKKSESHGTHVAGIIAAERNNGKGANGVANNVEIMSIRAVPNGDEYDKDVAKAIRYAVDNGATIINGSFGKSFSPHSDWVRDAIKYAADKDVLIVHAAGNDSKDIDVEPNFPADNINGKEVADNYISVGALAPKYGSGMVAGFSNYGDKNVDIFAPGAQVYSTTPENEYGTKGGTSMAAPAVAGIAALIRSYYPNLSAVQVKNVILDSGLPLTTKVVVGGDAENVQPFSNLSKSGRIANAFNALIMASKL
ncbi:S8 family peptidase [uncultured Winogradskyella sp.]|uniref:S8 family peptidase n=1 Tax=uncultured Winogradskyella sp. TaxID=395353 RepID=UPI002639F9ED|nr:S8 family peptidase [uncultured Winogradskyella sp.]